MYDGIGPSGVPIVRVASSEKVNRPFSSAGTTIPTALDYKPPTNYNDFPQLSSVIPIVGNNTSHLLEPADALHYVLSVGMIVIKHGELTNIVTNSHDHVHSPSQSADVIWPDYI